MAKLGDYVNIKTGKLDANASSENGKYPFFTCAVEPLKIDTYSYDCECVLVAGNGDLNVKYYDGKFDAYQRTYIIESCDKSRLFVPYMYYFLDKYVEKLRKQSIGGVIKYIKLGNLTNAVIPIPELSIQKMIVSNLDKVTHTIDLCSAILEKLDLLVKSRFVEMFGDPVSDTMRWGQKPLKEMLVSIRYGTSTPPQFSNKGFAFIRATNIKSGRIVNDDMKYISYQEAMKLEKCKLSGNEIIIVRSGVNAGDTCVVTEDYIGQYAGYDMILVLNKKLNPVFLNTLINTTYMERIVKPLTRRAAQPHLNSEQTQSFPIICTPIELQNQFAAFVEQTDKSKLAVKQVLEKAETLKKALMQEYFG